MAYVPANEEPGYIKLGTKTNKIRIENNRLEVWDDDSLENFGQIWIAVCLWCHRGPLNDEQLICGACPAEIVKRR